MALRNVAMKREGNKLTLTVELDKNYGKSKGKAGSDIVASSGGFVTVEGTDVKVNITAIK